MNINQDAFHSHAEKGHALPNRAKARNRGGKIIGAPGAKLATRDEGNHGGDISLATPGAQVINPDVATNYAVANNAGGGSCDGQAQSQSVRIYKISGHLLSVFSHMLTFS